MKAPLLALLLATPAFAQSWGVVPAPSGTTSLRSIWGRSLTQVYVGSGADSRVFVYDGSNWTTQTTILPPGSAVMGLAGDSSITLACGGFSGGSTAPFPSTTWSSMSLGAFGTNANAATRNAGITYVVGGAGRYAWGNAAPLSTVNTSLTSTTFWGVCSAGGFIAVGDNGTVITGNATAWTPRISGTSNTLFGVAALTSSIAVAVGANGQVLRSTNFGVNWVPINHGLTTNTLRAVSGQVGGTCVAVGDGGVILRSTDSGQNWTLQSSGTTANLQGVWMDTAATRTYVVGDAGTVLTSPIPAPGPFAITSPTHASFIETTTPTITWTSSFNAPDGYTLTLDDNSDFSSPVLVQAGIVATSFAVPAGALPPNSIYYLRVAASNTTGTTTASPQPLRFAVVAPITGCDPDFNHDGNIDQDDISALINVVAGGGCP